MTVRIGMLVDLYTPHISGVTNYVTLNKAWLERRGHDVFVFTFGGEADAEPGVVRSPGLPLKVAGVGLHFALDYDRAARELLETMDLLHVHHPFRSGLLALRYGRPRGLPVVFTNHTRYDLYARHYLPPVASALGRALLKMYWPWFCGRCDLVIAPSPGLRAVLQTLGARASVKVIPNGVDLAPFAHPAPLTRAEAGLPDDKVIVMYLGRLGPEKNLGFLLRAFRQAAMNCPEAGLAIVGGGKALANLRADVERAGLAGRVSLLGQVPYAQIPSVLRLADVFVTASQTEVHPFSLIEALASGLPALGIQSPGVSDTIIDGENGLLSAPDVEAFVAGMTRLVREPETRRRMGARARALAQQYDINQTGQSVLEEYERLVVYRSRAKLAVRASARTTSRSEMK